MGNPPYSGLPDGKLLLRDRLAIERTLLANERTLLSYLRSGISLIIAGVSIMHFATRPWFLFVGVICIPFGIIVSLIGIFRFRRQHRAITYIQKHSGPQKY